MNDTIANYRHLTANEITSLQGRGCASSDWGSIWVHPDFRTDFLRDVTFIGECQLGNFGGAEEAVVRSTGLYRTMLKGVTVGDHCLIQDVDLVENYQIGHHVTLQHLGVLRASGDSTYGNGLKVAVLNESGSREVVIHENLSASEAYFMALHNYRPGVCAAKQALAESFAKGERGFVGDHCVIGHVRRIENVRIGAYAVIEGASVLAEGSIVSTAGAPVVIGDGVTAEGFIIRGGSRIENGTSLTHCFVGEACHLGHGFTASESLFFANCQMENGEACALFAGPFSVSHHKATLLIACMTSFFNAGSGSNQSNHSYKLGPNKYGILERGAKLGSGSYLYWPARIGAFSSVLGHHSLHADLSVFPFSLLTEQKGRSLLIPAVNLRSIGLMRDAHKWPTRDGRAVITESSDRITFSLLNPYTAARIERALALLKEWIDAMPEEDVSAEPKPATGYVEYAGAYIPQSVLRRAYSTYSAALDEYLCRSILQRCGIWEGEALTARLAAGQEGTGAWCDYAGLIAPQQEMEEEGTTLRVAATDEELSVWEWNWVAAAARRLYGHCPGQMSETELCKIAVLYELTSEWLQSERLADGAKEYNAGARLLYGADGSEADRTVDFEASFGATCMNDSFVHRFHQQWKEQRADIVQIGRRFRSDVS